MIGEALWKKGFRNIIGADISQSMINIAESKGCYKFIKKTDILQPLPFEENKFDLLTAVGLTTYLSK